jgi:hypothetical protein
MKHGRHCPGTTKATLALDHPDQLLDGIGLCQVWNDGKVAKMCQTATSNQTPTAEDLQLKSCPFHHVSSEVVRHQRQWKDFAEQVAADCWMQV